LRVLSAAEPPVVDQTRVPVFVDFIAIAFPFIEHGFSMGNNRNNKAQLAGGRQK
jgi:hypothetical protein